MIRMQRGDGYIYLSGSVSSECFVKFLCKGPAFPLPGGQLLYLMRNAKHDRYGVARRLPAGVFVGSVYMTLHEGDIMDVMVKATSGATILVRRIEMAYEVLKEKIYDDFRVILWLCWKLYAVSTRDPV